MYSKATTSLVLIMVLGCGALSYGQETVPHTASAQELQINTWIEQLRDPARSPKTKLEAAAMLLVQKNGQSRDVLQHFLADSSNRPAQIAIAEAVIELQAVPEELIEPLVVLLNGDESSTRSAAAKALAICKDPVVSGKLLAIARDTRRPRAVRLEAIGALRRTLDRSIVDALVALLDDEDPMVVSAAVSSLARLTNIRAFGSDVSQWRQWWEDSKNKPETEWLAELVESFATARASLDAENAALRARLAKAVDDQYTATGAAQKDALLLSMLKDSLADVRLVGLKILERRLSSGEKGVGDSSGLVSSLLKDPDSRVRAVAPAIAVTMGACDAAMLLEALGDEKAVDVRRSLLMALGQLADASAAGPVIGYVRDPSAKVSAAAASALGRIAAKSPLPASLQAQAAAALVEKYKQTPVADDTHDLRELLVIAMSAVGDESFVPILRESLKDPAATVRLAAINALRARGKKDLVMAVEPLLDDADRGVRQAALAALEVLGGEGSIDLILMRTSGEFESDAAVKQQAWDVVMAVLSRSNAEVLAHVLDKLHDRQDAADQRLRVRQMLVTALRASASDQLPDALLSLGVELMQTGRASEAAPHFAEAHQSYAAVKSPKADETWMEWVTAMLAADDPLVVKVIAQHPAAPRRAEAIDRLVARLKAMLAEGRCDLCVELASAAVNGIENCPDKQSSALKSVLAEGRRLQDLADANRVHALCEQLVLEDAAAKDKAAAELTTMGQRAWAGLLAELKSAIGDESKAALEAATAAMLKQLNPQFVYDLQASPDQKLKAVEDAASRP